ncbi:MAG: hypothetical protein KAI84_09680 [Gammaproteobacteria bacterium]|nr:hypothetical protein [Gammaproteobacteria bacterium]
MFKTKQNFLNVSLLLTAVMLLSACGGNMIKPIKKGIVGQATVRNITVVTTDSVTSKSISAKVKTAVKKEAKDELKGNIQVDLKVTIDKWQGTENVIGGGVSSKLFGSKTYLNGVVDVLDTNTGEIIGKYTIYSEFKEGGLLGGKVTTVSFANTDQTVIDNFAMYTINHLE